MRKKGNVRTSWAGQFAKEASNDQFIREINDYDRALQNEIQRSIEHSAQLEDDINRMREQRKLMQEDPDGYPYKQNEYSQAVEESVNRSNIPEIPEEQFSSFDEAVNQYKHDEAITDYNARKVLSNYGKNWWNSHGRQMNDFQIQDFQGYLDRSDQWERLANDVIEYWDIEDRVNQINKEVSDLRMKTSPNTQGMMDISQQITNLLSEQKQLVQRHDELEPSVEAFKSYIPGGIKAQYYNLFAGDGSKNILSNNGIFGRTSQMHDEMGDILRFTSSMFSSKRTREEQRKMLDNALQEKQKKYKEWQRGLEANILDRERYGKVDDWFRRKEEQAGTNIFDADTWLYKMPGLIAGSTSGMSKILPAMITGAITGASVAATGGAAGLLIGAIGGATAYQMNYGAGVAENNSEVAMAYNERLEDYLQNQKGENGTLYDDIVAEGRKKLPAFKNFTDKQIFELYRKGGYTINNAAANKKMQELAVGIESQFQDDMAATTWTAGLETVLQILPVGKAITVAKPIRYQMLKTAARREALRNGTLSTLAQGYEIGQAASPILGALYAPIHLVMAPAFKRAGKIGSVILDNISKTSHIVEDIPSEILKRNFMKSTKKKYFKDIAGRWFTTSVAEGVEEGKQRISSDRYKNGYYTDAKIKSIGETILDDFLAGSKSAGLLLGMPFEGVMSEKDREILQEIKGGFILGGLQTSVVNASQAIAPYRAEQKATTAIVNSVLLDKAAKIDQLNKAKIYAEAAKSSSSYRNMLNGFDRLREANKTEYDSSGQYGIAPELIDEEEETFRKVAQMSVDGYTIKQAKAQGIDLNTEDFNNFVAAKALALDELENRQEVQKQSTKNLNDVRNAATDKFLDNMFKQAAAAIPGSNIEEQENNSVASFSSAENYNQFDTVARYTALLRMRDAVELGLINAQKGGHKISEKILNKKLTEINDKINNIKPIIEKYANEDETIDVNNLEVVENKLALDKDEHDKLTEAYRQSFVADQDLEFAFQQYERIIGEAYLNDKKIDYTKQVDWGKEFDNVTFKNGHARDVFKEIQDTIDDDNDLASVIDEDFENRTDDEGNEVITPEDAEVIENSAPQNDPEQEFKKDVEESTQEVKPVQETPVEPIQKPAEPVSTPQPTVVPEEPQTQSEEPKTAPRATRKAAPKQTEILAKLNTIAEQSKKNTKAVDHDSYTIEIDGKDVKIPRVHTIMPKYWAESESPFMPALQVGNAFDNLARMFFGDKNNLIEYIQDKQGLVQRLYDSFASDGKDEKMSQKKYSDLISNRSAFEATIDDLYSLFDQYDKLGWELSTEPIVWYAKFNNGWLAGETDMLAVDQEGNIHIIDFKTASSKIDTKQNPFGRFETKYTFSLPAELESRREQLNAEDFQVGPRKRGLSKTARNFIRDVRKAKGTNKLKVDWNSDTQQAELSYIDSNYSKVGTAFRVTHEYNGKTKGSKQDEYSDQLTAYREMIQRQLANVVDMEVVGFRVQYTHNGDDVTSIAGMRNEINGMPFRVKVGLSDEMGNILNNEGIPVEVQTTEPEPIVEQVENNEANDQVQKEELEKQDKSLPISPEPQPATPEEIAAAERFEVHGRSNLNDKVLDRDHPDLVNGIVFDKNFIADAIANGTVEVYTEVVKDRNGEIPSVYVDIAYKGKIYKRIFVYADDTLLTKVQALEKIKKPGQKIVATNISRTKGEIKPGEVKSVMESGLVDQEPMQLEFTPQNMSFGFVKDGNIVAFPNNNTKQQDIIGKTTAPNGTLMYMKRVPRTESEGGDKFIPVSISRRSLAGDADFIIDCLKKIDAIALPYTTTVGGKDVSLGVSRKELLDIILPYLEDINRVNRGYAIIRDNNLPSMFAIVNNQKQVIARVDIRNENSINEFKDALKTINVVEQNDVLASRIGNHTATPAFAKIKKFFATTKSGVKSINISENLKFDFEDFVENGLSGLGWYVKHGIFTSDYSGIGSPKVSINDVGFAENKPEINNPTQVKSAEEQVAPQVGFSIDDVPIIGNWGDLNKRMTVADENKPKLTRETIKKHLRPILGDAVDDPMVLQILDTIANDPRVKNAKVVGKASADAITIYNEAFEGVEYHEAFHRIFELFVPEAIRESVYQKAAKRLGIDLSKSTKENDYVGHRQVAEWLADEYMNRGRYIDYTGVQWLDRILNLIKDLVNVFVKGIIGGNGTRLYWTFLEINNGKYAKSPKKASKESIDRFNELFKELNYEIHSTNFEHIINDPMYEEVKNSAFYCILLGQNVDVSGATVQDTQISRAAFQRGADRMKKFGFDIFGTEVEPDKKNAAQLAMTEVMVKFDAVADDLAAMMANISTDYRKIMQDDARDDVDGGESASSYDENFMKWSYEFNRFDKTTSRVKFFFATIPDMKYTDDSKSAWTYATNSLGMPQLIPMNYVFNEVLSNLWDVDTIEEVVSRLSALAIDDPMYAIIRRNLQSVIDGRINSDGTTNADNEALLAQLMSTIRSNRHTFMLLRAVSNPEGLYDLVIQRSDADYNARVFPIQWSQALAKGGSETLKVDKYGNVVFNPNNAEAVHNFRAIAKLFEQLKDAVSSVNNGKGFVGMPSLYEYEDSMGNKNREVAWIEGRYTEDLTDPRGCTIVKNLIVEGFNMIGINIHTEEFDYMLKHKYGSSDWEALRQMIQSTDDADSINSFLFFLNNIVKDGKLNVAQDGTFTNQNGKQIPFENVYSDMAFVKELGNWKYEFRHAHDQLSVLATGGNRFYEMSDNDYMSDVLRDMNKRGKFFKDLKGDPYNYYSGETDNFGKEIIHGSVTLKQLSLNPNLKLALKHFIGFKTDKKGDEGQDYFEISRREDYLSKIGILENDGMVSLTLSDKKKYVYISGIKLPGLDYSDINKSKEPIVDVAKFAQQQLFPPSAGVTNWYDIQQLPEIVEQMRSYAISEYQSILQQLDKQNDGHRKVDNFDTKNQSVKFSSLLGVWEAVYDKDGNVTKEQYIPFNKEGRSAEETLAIAEAYFFNRPVEEQQSMIARLLTKRTEKELKTAVDLGLIEEVGNNKDPFLNYKNKGLNNKVIKSIKLSYIERYKDIKGLTEQMAESLAITMYINDISNKAIMSGQEMERLFSGNPAFYKWKYDKNGNLVDRTVDELKRLGGLGSTGNNNFTQLTNIPSKYLDKNGNFTGKYTCAEVNNEEVGSPQYKEMKEKMYEGQLRSLIIDHQLALEVKREEDNFQQIKKNIRSNKQLDYIEKQELLADALREHNDRLFKINDDVTDRIDNMSVEDLEKAYSDISEKAREMADDVSSALAKGIDVADGGAYISDTMCEMLLRMEGAYSKEIQEAFKILRGETQADYLGQIDAYQKVLTSVIGNQKYTAFGRRLQNGTSVPYYHKMALFPIFDCIATGKMRNVYDKMQEQGIDMLLVKSAVKVGGEGAKDIVWSDYRQDADPSNEDNFKGDIANQDWKPVFKEAFNFETYDCYFDYLRKQLNTDPKEEQMLRMGTQMQKIVYSNLIPGRTYTTQEVNEDGTPKTIKGRDLLNRIMDSSNKLSDIGVDKINKRFFVTNEDGQIVDIEGNIITDETLPNGEVIPARNSNKRVLDIEKFSNEVSKMMSERGADKNVMKALELVTSSNDTKQLSIPLGAISNANWLESVLISMINKDVVDVNTPGAFFIQRSVWAMQGMKMFDGKKNVKGDLSNRSLYDGKRLQMVNEEGSMDCVLSLDFFKNILPQVPTDEYEIDEDGNYVYERGEGGAYKVDEHMQPIPKKKMRDMTFTEARKWLIRKGIIGGKANIVAYRIPTQAESSIHALRCVDVIPVVRDTVILPEEFTKITGSDFDIDKLGLSTINWKHGSDKFKEGTEEYYQNQLIHDYITLLIDPKSQHILHRSIDKDTKLLKDVLAEIESDTTVEEEPYGFYSLSTQTERKDDYITGKIGIGPFALNNNNHILTMLYGVKFREFEDSIMTQLGLTDLSGHLDKDGNSIMSWLSALINAHVDIAKDPYVSRLNVGPFTYNLVNTLIRTGLGAKTFYFTTQPIMKELSKAYDRAGSSYMADQYKSKYQLQKDAIEQVGKDRFGELKIGEYTYDQLINGVTDPNDKQIKPIINAYIKRIFDDGILKKNANKEYSSATGIKIGDEELSADQVQLLMYLAYLQFDPYATSVSNLVKYSKIDTKKHGKSYVEQQVFLKGFKKLFDNPDGSGLFEPEGLQRLSKQSYIELKTINAISMTENILKGQFLQATNAFKNAIQVVLNMIGKGDSLSVDLWNEVSHAIMASIKSEYINQYAKNLRPNNPTYIHDLVSESEENLEYTQTAGTNRIKLVGKPKYDIKSYIHKKVYVSFDYNDKHYDFDYTIIGYDEDTNELIVDQFRKVDNNGKIRITGGENTIYDRFNRLSIELRDNVEYRDVLDSAGEPTNMLLRSLVTGKTFEYKPIQFTLNYVKPEGADTYETLKFVKLFNALDQNGVESNYIIDAWDALLHDDEHPKLKEFAEDLVVYAFVTSGDQGGFTKFFKQVPFSWRKESGYADFITRKLVEYQSSDIDNAQLEDAILNNWFNSLLVPKYDLVDKKADKPNFMAYYNETKKSNYLKQREYPTILAALKDNNGILEVSINPDDAPLFIKIPRRKDSDAKDSQRRVTVYRRMTYGMRRSSDGSWVHYPIYVKVEPKGNLLRGNFLMTEYGREDSLNKEYGPSEDGLRQMFTLGDFISRNDVEAYKDKYNNLFGQMIEDMNYQNLYENKFNRDEEMFTKSLNKKPYKGVTKIISGGQTGVDTIGLEVGRELGIETGGTMTPGFVREKDVDQYTRQQLEEFGLQEISPELQGGKSGKEFYLPRTEQNVINSDGTVYFASDEDFSGKNATERYARIHNKPFLLNPTAEQLKDWLEQNDISILNVAGNRGSKIGNMRDSVVNVLKQALNKNEVVEEELTQEEIEQNNKIEEVLTNSEDNLGDHFYSGNVTPEDNVIFVFGSNTEGRHGAGAAKVAKDDFGAIYGQAEGLQGNAYAIITKDLNKAKEASWQYLGKSEDWYTPGEKEEKHIKWWYNPPKPIQKGTVPKGYKETTIEGVPALEYKTNGGPNNNKAYYYYKDGKYYNAYYTQDAKENWYLKSEEVTNIPNKVQYYFEGEDEKTHYYSVAETLSKMFGSYNKDDYEGHSYSEVYNHPLNKRRSVKPERILEQIKKLYEVARQNPDKVFKVQNYQSGKISLNGYLGEEMMQLFIDAGPIPSNVQFNEEWSDVMYKYMQHDTSNDLSQEEVEKLKKEAEEIKKQCKGK